VASNLALPLYELDIKSTVMPTRIDNKLLAFLVLMLAPVDLDTNALVD
jgi:hypothetical protein